MVPKPSGYRGVAALVFAQRAVQATAVGSGWCSGTPLALQKRVTYNRPCGAMDAQEERGWYRCRSIQITSLW
jgi:hypothetical protein